MLSRLNGLTVDHLEAEDIVTWAAKLGKAQLRQVSADSATSDERDLFWPGSHFPDLRVRDGRVAVIDKRDVVRRLQPRTSTGDFVLLR